MKAKNYSAESSISEELDTRINNNMKVFSEVYGLSKRSEFIKMSLGKLCASLEALERSKILTQ